MTESNTTSDSVLAVDIGGSKLLAGIVDPCGNILDTYRVEFLKTPDREIVVNAVAEAADKLLKGGAVGAGRIGKVGINIPGLADSKNGIWVDAPFSGIKNFNIAEEIGDMLSLPVYIENDVNSCALAEKYYGICKNTEDYIWITISNGIGGSIVTSGNLYTGFSGNAGEIGHLVVENDPELAFKCGCGNTGCLEAMAAGPAIARWYQRFESDKPALSSKDVGEYAKQGDLNAVKAFNMAAHYLAKGISYAVNLLNPEKVVLGGGVTMDYDLWKYAFISELKKFTFNKANQDLSVELTGLGYNAALLGAAAITRNGE